MHTPTKGVKYAQIELTKQNSWANIKSNKREDQTKIKVNSFLEQKQENDEADFSHKSSKTGSKQRSDVLDWNYGKKGQSKNIGGEKMRTKSSKFTQIRIDK